MFTSDPHDALVVAHERGRRLRAEAQRLCPSSRTRSVLATVLRCAANRLEPAPLGHRAA